MFARLLLLFTVVPLVELWLLLVISDWTSWQTTVLLVIATGVLGASLSRRQGWQTWQRINQRASRGETPTDELLDGLMIFIAGALLVTPGVLTDVVGFSLLVPTFRSVLKKRVAEWVKTRTVVHFQSAQFDQTQPGHDPPRDKTVIDAEFTSRTASDDDQATDD